MLLRILSPLAFAFGLAAGSVAMAQGLLPPGDVPRGQSAAQAQPVQGQPMQVLPAQMQPGAQAQAAQPPATAPLPPKKPAPPALAGPPRTLPPAPAPDGRAQRATVDRVNAYYNSIQSLTGTFTQVDPDGSRRTGDFYMQKPGRVRFEYDPPSPIELIANGQSVAVRDRTLNTQDITPLDQTPLRFLLAERIDLANDPHVTGIYQDDHFVSVVIEEKVPMIGTYRLLILFDAKDYTLRQWIVTDPQGYDTQVSISNLKPNGRPDPKLFVINFERMLQ
ncbi:outer-membrane lipoprotein carrier protein LolA [Xanthobacter sp. KR7-225]|uniref:LolA family protein n=1 Tax=Xanthobacter sp. KR7-225 TaxID=3156613 RepID=UPI0032B4C63A